MKLLRAEPGEGLVWIRRAFRTFGRQPFGLAGLLAVCVFIVWTVSWIPILGGALSVLSPAGTLLFMIATSRVEAGERPLPGALAAILGAGRPRLVELLKLGVAYFVASALAMLIIAAIDGGATATWMEAVSGAAGSASGASAPGASGPAASQAPLPDARMLFSSLGRMVVLALLSVPFWHAPALVYWGRQGFAKSLFFSTVAIWRNRGAFAVYGLGWFGLSLAGAMVFSVLAALLGGPPRPSLVAVMVLVVAILLYLTLFFSSLWHTVVGCFAIEPEDDEAVAAPPSPPPKETLS